MVFEPLFPFQKRKANAYTSGKFCELESDAQLCLFWEGKSVDKTYEITKVYKAIGLAPLKRSVNFKDGILPSTTPGRLREMYNATKAVLDKVTQFSWAVI